MLSPSSASVSTTPSSPVDTCSSTRRPAGPPTSRSAATRAITAATTRPRSTSTASSPTRGSPRTGGSWTPRRGAGGPREAGYDEAPGRGCNAARGEPRSPVGVEEPLFPERPPDEDDLREYEPVQPSSGLRDLLRKIFAPVLVGLGLIAKFGIFSLKFFGIFLAVGGYALIWGWRFAIGFVLLILVHEVGHFVEARLQGFRPSLPVFIPFIGAYVAIKDASPDPWLYAKRALAGPIAGGLASAVCYAVAVQNGSDLLSALAYVG